MNTENKCLKEKSKSLAPACFNKSPAESLSDALRTFRIDLKGPSVALTSAIYAGCCRTLHFALCALVLAFTSLPNSSHAHGFNANHVDIVKTFGRKYRVIIKYTHVEVGEYREAHIDFDKKEEAIKAFQDLAKGADFFLGDVKNSIHFHTPPESNSPY